MAKERIGILGGTFDPIHMGHIAMAEAALAYVDRVLLLPDRVPPHKQGISPAEDRWRMVCAAAFGHEGLQPSRLELEREGTTYTFDTLTHLRSSFPRARLFYIIGADTLLELCHWHRWEEVLQLCTVLVAPRTVPQGPDVLQAERRRLEALGGHFILMTCDTVDVSSTGLREAMQNGRPAQYLLPSVREYCEACGLYGMPRRLPEAGWWLAQLFRDLNIHRFTHTLGVAWSAKRLARQHGVDISTCYEL